MNRTWFCFGVLLVALAMVVACGKPPQEDMDSAKAALEDARTAQADKWASAEFQAAARNSWLAKTLAKLARPTKCTGGVTSVASESASARS